MTAEWQAHCKDPEVAKGLIILAGTTGWERSEPGDDFAYRWVYARDAKLRGSVGSFAADVGMISISEAIIRIMAGPPDDAIYAEDCGNKVQVEFRNDGSVSIGGKVFPLETLEQIAHQLEHGPIQLRGRTVRFLCVEGDDNYAVSYCGIKILRDTLDAILKRANATAKPKPTPEPSLEREFAEAVAVGHIGAFAVKQGWPRNGQGEAPVDLRMYGKFIAKKVLEATKH